MPVEILMPSTGASMTEGSIARWVKREGDAVKRGDVLLEIETDKAIVDVEAPDDGVLGKILVGDGASGVKVETVIGLLAVNGESFDSAQGTPFDSAQGKGRSLSEVEGSQPSAASPALCPHSAVVEATPVPGGEGRIFASPLARRIAQQLGLDLAKIRGSGPNGRVLRADVERAAQSAAVVPSVAAVAVPTTSAPAVPATVAYDEIPHTTMRRVIAQRLGEAKRNIPHFYLTVDCNVDALLALRKEVNEQLGLKISINDFIVKAAAIALERVPGVNASWTDEAVRRYRTVDISVAVATPNGLITPIVRNANEKTLSRISADVKDLAARARDGKLKPEEFQGGGFTISNLGMYGIREFSAIINPPQACILAVGASEQRPVVRDGQLAVGTLTTCTLSVDHRVVDGALGAEFLAEFRKLLEAPMAMLI